MHEPQNDNFTFVIGITWFFCLFLLKSLQRTWKSMIQQYCESSDKTVVSTCIYNWKKNTQLISLHVYRVTQQIYNHYHDTGISREKTYSKNKKISKCKRGHCYKANLKLHG